MSFDAGSIWATLYLNRDPFDRGLAEAEAAAAAFEKGITIPVRLDATPFEGAATAVSQQKADLGAPVTPPVSMDTGEFTRQAAGVDVAKDRIADPVVVPVTMEVHEKYDGLLGSLLEAGATPGELPAALSGLGESLRDARVIVNSYLTRVAAEQRVERIALADGLVGALLPNSDEFQAALERGFYAMAPGERMLYGLYSVLSNERYYNAIPTTARSGGGQAALPPGSFGYYPEPYAGGAGDWRWAYSGHAGPGAGGMGSVVDNAIEAEVLRAASASIGGFGGGGGDRGGSPKGLGAASNFLDARIMRGFGVPASIAGALALSLPVIVSVGAALFAAAAGFTALGVAAAPTALAIGEGYKAIDQANTALAATVPGTQAWVTAIGGVANAWSNVAPALRPAIADIQSLFSGNAVTAQAQTWLVGLIGQVTGFLGHRTGSVFEPLILATEHATNGLVSGMETAFGSAHFAAFIKTLASDVGPAVKGLSAIVVNLAHAFGGLAHAVGFGRQGLNLLVQLSSTLNQLAHSAGLAGFVQGFVEADRMILNIVSGVLRIGDAIDKRLNLPIVHTIGYLAGAYLAASRLLSLFGVAGGLKGLGERLAGTAAGGAAAAAGGTTAAVATDVAAAEAGVIAGSRAEALQAIRVSVGSALANINWGALVGLGLAAYGGYQIVHSYTQPGGPGWQQTTLADAGVPQNTAQMQHDVTNVQRFNHYVGDVVSGLHSAWSWLSNAVTSHSQVPTTYPWTGVGAGRAGTPQAAAMAAANRAMQGTNLAMQRVDAQQAAAVYASDYASISARLLPAAWRSHSGEVATMYAQSISSMLQRAFSSGEFTHFAAPAAQTIGQMISGLDSRNNAVKNWLSNFVQIFHEAGPQVHGALSLIAAQAPQDLGTIAADLRSKSPAARTAVRQLFVGMEEQIVLGSLAAKAASKAGMQGMIAELDNDIHSGNPILAAAARQVAQALGINLTSTAKTVTSVWSSTLSAILSLLHTTQAQIATTVGQTYLHSRGYGGAFGGGHALGGPVDPMIAYLVGERGPELFVPNVSGTIVPNSALAGGGGSHIQVNLYIDASGSPSPLTSTAAANALARQIIPQVRQALRSAVSANRP